MLKLEADVDQELGCAAVAAAVARFEGDPISGAAPHQSASIRSGSRPWRLLQAASARALRMVLEWTTRIISSNRSRSELVRVPREFLSCSLDSSLENGSGSGVLMCASSN